MFLAGLQHFPVTAKAVGDQEAVAGAELLPVAVLVDQRAAAAQVEASVDVRDFVRKTVTENRLQQALGEVFGDKNEPRMSKTRAFIEWVKSDVLKEEADTLAASGLTARDVVRPISDAARFWLKKKGQ